MEFDKDIEGDVAIVTGANSGLGFETTKELASMDATVVMACRDLKKGRAARGEIEDEHPFADLRVLEIDLASLDSIHSFSREFRKSFDRLDILINNAGVMMCPWRTTDFGFEYQFGVNHLGHLALDQKLIDLIEQTEGSRVVSVTSLYHRKAEMDFDKLNSESEYEKTRAYADSKMANLMYAIELDERFKIKDIDSKAAAAHPGFSNTNLQLNAGEWMGGFVGRKIAGGMNKIIGQPASKGAEPILYAALSDEIEGGELVGPDGFKQMRGEPEIQEPDERALDADLRQRLWEYSEEQLNLNYRI